MSRAPRIVLLFAASGACSAGSSPGFTSESPLGGPAEPGTVIRGEGQSCGGYPAAGAPIEMCAKGLRCDFDGGAVDAPGRCRR